MNSGRKEIMEEMAKLRTHFEARPIPLTTAQQIEFLREIREYLLTWATRSGTRNFIEFHIDAKITELEGKKI